jgi:FkbM family methyltransferase
MTDTRKGFIVTYFKTSDQGESMLRDLIDTISTENYYLVLAAHSPVPVEIYSKCDYYIYQELNVVDDRKYSHGVAESNLIDLALLHLAYKEIEWTYKVCYDVQVNDVNHFKEWVKEGYNFVTCNWGEYYICTNSFYGNVDWLLSNIRFYKNIEDMFSDNTVLEACWQMSIERNGIKDEVYSWPNKTEFFGPNKIDVLFYDYNQFQFWYSPEEGRFYIQNNGQDVNCKVRIFDYYTDICMYENSFDLGQGSSYWIVPSKAERLHECENGFYAEFYTDSGIVRKNFSIKDFEHKHSFAKKFKTFKHKEIKFDEYLEFSNFNGYQYLDLNLDEIKTFIDIGANYGFVSLPFVERDAKVYMVDADKTNIDLLKNIYGKRKNIEIIDKAISNVNGTVDFYLDQEYATVSSMDSIGQGGTGNNRIKTTVQSITFNSLLSDYVKEPEVDLVKIDIEGAEYSLFEAATEQTLKRVKRFLIEFHANHDYRAMEIIQKLAKCDFKYKLYPWGWSTDYIIENKMGIIYAYR